ncbi:hypothetical protein ABH935_008611 [Catenulispora sp. GAS73]|uniref:hypothetical protein n=1 Tax=Catenulispora sp. GAS73 TaxID=3156269 RepID=UPI0035148FAA
MSRYAVDVERRLLLATHATGAGDVGFTVAALPTDLAQDDGCGRRRVWTGFDRVLWRCYTHPIEAAG